MRRKIEILVVSVLLLALFAGAALAASITCTGGLCEGTDNEDTLSGTSGFDEINGKGAADKIFGLDGGPGTDTCAKDPGDQAVNCP